MIHFFFAKGHCCQCGEERHGVKWHTPLWTVEAWADRVRKASAEECRWCSKGGGMPVSVYQNFEIENYKFYRIWVNIWIGRVAMLLRLIALFFVVSCCFLATVLTIVDGVTGTFFSFFLKELSVQSNSCFPGYGCCRWNNCAVTCCITAFQWG